MKSDEIFSHKQHFIWVNILGSSEIIKSKQDWSLIVLYVKEMRQHCGNYTAIEILVHLNYEIWAIFQSILFGLLNLWGLNCNLLLKMILNWFAKKSLTSKPLSSTQEFVLDLPHLQQRSMKARSSHPPPAPLKIYDSSKRCTLISLW